MDTRKVTSQYRLTSWTQTLQERIVQKESIKDFCQRKGFSKNTYFYWQRKIRETACKQLSITRSAPNQTGLPVPAFTEVRVNEIQPTTNKNELVVAGQIKLEISGVKITADSAYPTEKLAVLCRELMRSC